MAPATPTGFHADTTETSIEWHWNAVDGAIGYVVQVSPDEMFDDNDPQIPTAETHHTVADLEPGTTLYGRVRAAGGTLEAPLLSPWTTHRTATSDVPPEPEPPPTPAVMVDFSLSDDAKKSYFMVPDDDDDKDTAMAWVNPEIMVESNSSAIITPMFLEDANGVSVDEGMNMPFAFVGAEDNWELLQSMVLSDGATFKVQRTTVGANQEMEPTGDVAYVTCGPFACTESMMEVPAAPGIEIEDSGVCSGWNPMVEVEVGFVNNEIDTDAATDGDQDAMDGVDIGWRTTSNVAMTVKHHFKGVANGLNMTVSGPDAAKGSSEALKMTSTGIGAVTATKYSPALIQGAGADGDLTLTADNTLVCAGADAGEPYGGSTASALDMPEECFRVNTRGSAKTNYFGGYSIELAAKGSAVSWGEIAWDQFKELTCDSKTFAVADEVDVCDLFEDEVDAALEEKWGAATYSIVDTAGDPSTSAAATDRLGDLMSVVPSSATSRRFATVWYDANGNGKATVDLYSDTDDSTPAVVDRPSLTFELLDNDNDHKFGDFGKVDFSRRNPNDTTASVSTDDGSWEFKSDGNAENADTGETKCTDDDGGDGCDAEFSEMVDIKIESGSALGCKTLRTVTITCSWDADGEMGRYRRDDHEVDTGTGATVIDRFGGLVAAETGGDRTAGYVGAFAKCEVK